MQFDPHSQRTRYHRHQQAQRQTHPRKTDGKGRQERREIKQSHAFTSNYEKDSLLLDHLSPTECLRHTTEIKESATKKHIVDASSIVVFCRHCDAKEPQAIFALPFSCDFLPFVECGAFFAKRVIGDV
jgi:hypothetical protein